MVFSIFLRVVFWTVLYAVEIVSFGIIYYALPGDSFYQSNLFVEPAFQAKLIDAGVVIGTFLRREARINLNALVHSKGRDIAAITVIVRSIQNDTHLKITLFLQYLPKAEDALPESGIQLHFIGSLSAQVSRDGYHYLMLEADCSQCDEQELAEHNPALYVELLGPEFDLMSTIVEEQSGQMTNNSERFERLIYFSAITAATIGYGDIVPTTKTSRTFASLQAVVSIVTLGMFINSLSGVSRRGQEINV